MKTIYITKYALTKGIQEAEIPDDSKERGIIVIRAETPSGLSYGYPLGPTEWHHTREEAIAKAEELRVAKIASLKKALSKIKNLKF